MTLHVRHGGVLTTVQDPGRSGWRHLGVAHAGALDPAQASLANRLVGNPADAARLQRLERGVRDMRHLLEAMLSAARRTPLLSAPRGVRSPTTS